MRFVIIGNNVAGIHDAESIRQLDPNSAITMISDDFFPPGCHPITSMVLEGAVFPHPPPVSSSAYDDLKITPVLGNLVLAIDVDNRSVSVKDKIYRYAISL